MGFGFKNSGSFNNLELFFKRVSGNQLFSDLQRFGQMGVNALAKATPIDTGKTTRSWEYRIVQARGKVGVEWFNTHENNGANIAILIQYGHGTGTGGYIQGVDYINPAIKPIFDQISNEIWKKVTRV